ncbi:DMT family transporter [Pseudoduganella violacea]|uniref:Drug/metabolite transporter (DMT)-like permease n=1 Tax=Pseudoduganella violacea TaxID=1715466 RepID=A0A7W5FS38_9BURK|nr:DMT family transporter [Pseudoduganella violacea]MBB3117111.1 drug/metabolite transporter (DMT)-like permease [Pseudoduganella violacea]
MNGLTRILPLISLLVTLTIWASVPTVAKAALAHVSLVTYLMLRYTLAGLFMLPYLKQTVAGASGLSWRSWAVLVVSSCLIIYVQTWAIQQVTASWYIVVFSSCPVLIALLLRYRFTTRAVAGLLATVAGLALYLQDSHAAGAPFQLGALLGVLTGMLAWVAYTVIITRFHAVYNDTQITAICSYIGALFSLMLFIAAGDYSVRQASWPVAAAIIVSGVLMPLSLWCYSYSMRKAEALTIFGQYLEPLIGLFIAFLVFGAELTAFACGAVALILCGTIAVTRYSVKPVRP